MPEQLVHHQKTESDQQIKLLKRKGDNYENHRYGGSGRVQCRN